MDRREFLKNSAIAATVGATTGPLVACSQNDDQVDSPNIVTQPNIQWRLASSFPRGLDTIYGAAEVLSERVEAMSGGKFKIRVYPAGEMVPALQVLDAVQQGTLQVGQTASYYFVGKNPALAFDTCVPFGLTARQQAAWLHEAGGLALMNEMFSDFNIITFPCGNTGAQMGGWFRKDINSAQDLRGLKMRIPGMGGKVMSKLGATVQVIPGGEIYPALERGAIDATEWVGPYDDEKLGFYKVAKKYYYPGWWEPGPSLSLYVNQDAWAKLPVTYQEIFRSAARDAEGTMQARYDAKNPAAFQRLMKAGVELKKFSPDVMEAAERASFEIMEEEAAKNASYRKVYEAWKKIRTDSFAWFATAELAYQTYAFTSKR